MHTYCVIVEGKTIYISLDLTKMSAEITINDGDRDLTAKAKLKEVK
jgi:hypothetical protein